MSSEEQSKTIAKEEDDSSNKSNNGLAHPISAPRTVYLTLGDGDFSYSLDLVRYISMSLDTAHDGRGSKASEIHSSVKLAGTVELVATGFDTVEELTAKYKDAPFILYQLQKHQDRTQRIFVSVRHGVNVLVPMIETQTGLAFTGADHVIFHHPHLGTENADLHSRFLAHVFHSVARYWMKPDGGIFHLTLVREQHERWKCDAAAQRAGFVLLDVVTFMSPPVAQSKYHLRRHQTGKSFASRRPSNESITYSYGRSNCKGGHSTVCLPWQKTVSIDEAKSGRSQEKTTSCDNTSYLSCPYCNKEFGEERSRKSHIRDKHPDECNGSKVQQKKPGLCAISVGSRGNHWCGDCLNESGASRLFQSIKDLQAHVVAKHSGIYTYIAPDWSLAKKKSVKQAEKDILRPSALGTQHPGNKCAVCDLDLHGRSESEHLLDFVPRVDHRSINFCCSYCTRSFREERAQMQHENFCQKRSNIVSSM
jgi:hypothetical protein